MLTKDILTAEVKELREQFQKASQQLLAAKQEAENLQASVEQLKGAIIITEKYLSVIDTDIAKEAVCPSQDGAIFAPVSSL